MRVALLLGALLAAGCSVPAVQFHDDGAGDSGVDGTVEAPADDGGADSAAEAKAEGGVMFDGAYDGPLYCNGNAPPDGGTCCTSGTGPVCVGGCTKKACMACTATGPCESPNVCCTSGGNGTCQLPPC
ncbi:MAG: hypothetical protein ACRELB_09245 [Polyangiaceae bacterium]